jgi:cytidyltransferase-like protein
LETKEKGSFISLLVESHSASEKDKKRILNSSLSVCMTKDSKENFVISEWLEKVSNPAGKFVFLKNGHKLKANSKEIYTAVTNGMPLVEYLNTKEDVVNAISGAISYLLEEKFNKISRKRNLINEVIDFIDTKSKKKVADYAIIPGKFKPPHRGHLNMIKHYSQLADKVIILVSPIAKQTAEAEITASDSVRIWQIYIDAAGLTNVDVEIPNENSPVRAAIEYGNDPGLEGSKIILGASTKDEDAAGRFSGNVQKYVPDAEILDPLKYAFNPDSQDSELYAQDIRDEYLITGDLDKWIPREALSKVDDILQILNVESTLEESSDLYSMFGGSAGNGYDYLTNIAENSAEPRMSMRDDGPTGEWTNDKKEKETTGVQKKQKQMPVPAATQPVQTNSPVDQEITINPEDGIKITNKVNELSSMGGGSGEIGAGPGKRDSLIREEEEEEELIEEVMDYLLEMIGENNADR